MSRIKVLMVNTDQGLILNASTIYATFSRRANLIVVKNPWKLKDFNIPDGFSDYTIIEGQLPSINLDLATQDPTEKIYALRVFSMDSQRFYYYNMDSRTKLCDDILNATPLFSFEIPIATAELSRFSSYEILPVDTRLVNTHLPA